MKEIVKDLEQAIFGDNDNDDNNDDEDLLEAEELDRRFKTLISKKRIESLEEELEKAEELDRRFKTLIGKNHLENI